MYLRYVDNFNRGSFKTTGYYGIPAMKYQSFKISDNITPFNERNNNADGIHFLLMITSSKEFGIDQMRILKC